MGQPMDASMKKFEYLRPKTVDETLALLEKHGKKAKLIASGIEVIIRIKVPA